MGELCTSVKEVRAIRRQSNSLSKVISALAARSQLGRLLEQAAEQGRSFVIEKRGTPKAVLLGIRDYIKLAAPEPEVLKTIGEGSIRRGTDRLTMRQIDRIIGEARVIRSRRHAAS